MNIPTVGSFVEVNVRFRNANLFTYKEKPFDDFLLSGEIIKNERWIPADSFMLQTGNPKHPISVITLKNVTSIQVLKGSDKKNKLRKFKVSGKHTHTVLLASNHYSCDCIGFKYHAKCKHIEAVKKSLQSKT